MLQTSVPGNILVTNDQTEDQPMEGAGMNCKVMSRPSTQNTVKDGIIIRWEADEKPLLRRPRTASNTSSSREAIKDT